MFHSTTDRIVISISVLIVIGCFGAIGWVLVGPVRTAVPQFDGSDRIMPARESMVSEASRQVLVDATWRKRLRRKTPSQTLPQREEKESLPSAVRLSLKLVGTIIEKGKSYAMVSDGSGNVDLQPVGGLLEIEPQGVRIERIDRRRVEISYAGARSSLELGQQAERDDGSASGSVADHSKHSSASTEEKPQLTDVERPQFESLDDELEWMNGLAESLEVDEAAAAVPEAQGDK